MKRPAPEPVFLARQSYRRRRLGDAARLLSLVGMVLFFMPILWSSAARTATSGVYLFGVWALLILAVALISRALRRAEPDAEPDDLPTGE